jgi:hypothetical protein
VRGINRVEGRVGDDVTRKGELGGFNCFHHSMHALMGLSCLEAELSICQ